MEFTAKIATPGQPVHPGETLRDRIVELGMTPREFAQQTGLSPIRLNQIIACKQSVTADVAVLISGQSGQNAEFWMNLQTAYDLAIATQGSTEGTEEVLDGELKAPFKTIVELSSDEARMFLLKAESYCTIDLPDYIQFNELLDSVINALRMHDPNTTLARQHDDVNHIIMTNKDGEYAWRPLELVHPVLYVCLAQQVTESRHWDTIIDRFAHFAQDEKVQCVSLPVQSLTDESDKAQQIRQWRVSMEQKSIELSLDYDYCAQTDIVDCYPSIYTHSVAWALHGKSVAKTKRSDRTLIGNIIDRLLQDMHLGQTNGIPQGSVLMDFIAEMVLGYADVELSSRCSGDGINDYRILRYRDDYRIFVNNPSDGDRILKHLTEVLIDLGLKLNPAKTGFSANVIHSSVKDDKLDWIFKKHRARGLQNWLLMIHDHGLNHPNSGQLVGALASVHNRLHRRGRLSSPMPLIAIVGGYRYPQSKNVPSRCCHTWGTNPVYRR